MVYKVLFGGRVKKLYQKHLLGWQGQKQCEKYLKGKGLKLLARNFSCRTGEIDLIMTEDNGTIVFIEVKTRSNEKFADAEGAITKAKKHRFKSATQFFITKNKLENFPLRFDVVIVIDNKTDKPQIRHYQNAF